MSDPRINKWVDFVDRVAWTFIMSFAGTIVVLGLDDWMQALSVAVVAALGAAVKTGAAQRIGNSGIGDAVPGASVIKNS